jgi:VanZ family protein
MAFISRQIEARLVDPRLVAVAAGYTLFVVYGSLLPLELRPLTWEAAWSAYRDMPFLVLGVGKRADWVANGVLYLPLAVLWSAWLSRRREFRLGFAGAALVLGGCAALALAVEFAQLFFPPRTVSQNDVFAEVVGSGAGVALWFAAGRLVAGMAEQAGSGGFPAVRFALAAYASAYALLALFPFDFVVSGRELAERLESEAIHVLVAPACGGLLRCGSKLGIEIALLVPFGALLSFALDRSHRHQILAGFLIGAIFGAAVEGVQLFLHSGVVQGASIVSRATGVAAGIAAAKSLRGFPGVRIRGFCRSGAPVLGLLYACALPAMAWLARPPKLAWVAASAEFERINWLPFYYHYYSTEQHALFSLLLNAVLYAPLGAAFGLWSWAGGRARSGVAAVGLVAAVVAVLVEASRLFRAETGHADPTNVLIAAVAALAGRAAVLRAVRLFEGFVAPASDPVGFGRLPASASPRMSLSGDPGYAAAAFGAQRVFAAGLLAGLAAVLFRHPVAPLAIAAAFALYAAVLVRFPLAWLLVTPALLPLVDLSPWTGWLLFDEFDLFVMATLAVNLWRTRIERADFALPRMAAWAVAAVAVSYAVSAVRGLQPLAPFDWNAIGTYDTGYNALRLLKPCVWALALLPFLASAHRRDPHAPLMLCSGLAAGLGALSLAILHERQLFPGLLNFSMDYRVTGTFFSMHVGDQYVDAFLVASAPFIGALPLWRPRRLYVAVAAVLALAAFYAVIVTYSRGTYFAWVLAVAVAVGGHLVAQRAARAARRAAVAAALMAGIAVAAGAVASVPYAKARFANSSADLHARVVKWRAALAARDRDIATELFGMGLGTFPRAFRARNSEAAAAGRHRFVTEQDDAFVRFDGIRPIFFGQRIGLEPHATYRFEFDARASGGRSEVSVYLCERSVLYSFDCVLQTLSFQAPPGRWFHHQHLLRVERQGLPRGSYGWLSRRPLEVGLAYRRGAGPLDIDNFRLFDPSGRDRISNGDFSRGGERWFFSVDHHDLWHEDNLFVHLLFERGWLGVAAFLLLSVAAVASLCRRIRQGDRLAPLFLAAIAGLYAVGLFGTLIDAPRIALLGLLLLLAAVCRPPPVGQSSTQSAGGLGSTH